MVCLTDIVSASPNVNNTVVVFNSVISNHRAIYQK